MSLPDPVPPLTQLAAAAATLHELYLAYIEAGFDADQAFQLVLIVQQRALTPQ